MFESVRSTTTIGARLTTPRPFALDDTDHAGHEKQAGVIRRQLIGRNGPAADERLREVVAKANDA
ncbi:hypothetical protein [Kitasatospora sp. NPDC056181]|uniref:hypothetical protein n=1 Tax=Kitasatospora sp. NPDC056181 TaxID=3345737 RepID=UPI0035DAD15F